MILGVYFGQGPFALDTTIETTITGSLRSLAFLKEGGGGGGRGCFYGQKVFPNSVTVGYFIMLTFT